jgi:hypothetical protein
LISARACSIAVELANEIRKNADRQYEYRLAFWRVYDDNIERILDEDISSDMKVEKLRELRKRSDQFATLQGSDQT